MSNLPIVYFHGTLHGDLPSHKLVEVQPRQDGEPGLEIARLLASTTTIESAIAAGSLITGACMEPSGSFADGNVHAGVGIPLRATHPIECDLDEDCSCDPEEPVLH